MSLRRSHWPGSTPPTTSRLSAARVLSLVKCHKTASREVLQALLHGLSSSHCAPLNIFSKSQSAHAFESCGEHLRTITWVLLAVLTATPASAQVLTRATLHPGTRTVVRQGPRLPPPPPPPPAPPSTEAHPSVTLTPAAMTVTQGDAATVLGKLEGQNGFSGLTSLTTTVDPAVNAPMIQVNPTSATVAGAAIDFTVLVSTTLATAVGDYTVTVTATGASGTSGTATLTITVIAASTDFFSQGTLQFSTNDSARPAVAIQAVDIYFGQNHSGLLSVRATLPTSSSAPPGGASVHSQPNQNLKTQVLDAFGGVVNVAGVWQSPQKSHLTFDARGALKVVEVPRDVSVTASDAFTQTPFFTFGANGRLSLQGADRSGNAAIVTLVGSYFINAIADASVPARFTTPLDRVTQGVNTSFTLTFPSAHLYIVGQYRWCSDKQIGQEFVFSVNPTK